MPQSNLAGGSSVPLLRAENIDVQFGGLKAVDDVSLDVAAGEIVGLIGPNGAGKTTLFQAISGFVKPNRGTVWFDGARIDGLGPVEICRAGLARTFQIVEVFPTLTVAETLTAAALFRVKMAEAKKVAAEVAQLVGLGAKQHVLCRHLTLPDQKALEVGKAIATRPRMILLDEVMAGLRPSEVTTVMALIRSLRDKGITFLLVEHLMEVVMTISDRVVVLGSGRKIAEGRPEEVAANQQVIDIYLGEDLTRA